MSSRAVGHREIVCDGCGDVFSYRGLLGEIRDLARDRGWRYRLEARKRAPARAVDLCPDCTKPRPERRHRAAPRV